MACPVHVRVDILRVGCVLGAKWEETFNQKVLETEPVLT